VRDVVVVGAGPAGLLAARRCAEAGLDVLVLEEHPRIGHPTHCTGILSLEAADLVKIPEDIVLNRLERAVLVSPGGHRSGVTWGDEGREQILVVDRGEFDWRMAQDAVTAGASLRTGMRVEHVHASASAVEIAAGGEWLRARQVILASGISYGLQRQLGLPLPRRVVHTAQVEVPADASDLVELHFGTSVAPGGFIWVAPVRREGRPLVKIGVMARGDAGACLQAFLDRPEVRRRLHAPAPPPVRRLLPLGPAPRTYADRVMVAGDAGGLTKPTTGGGIFYSLLSGAFAAETAVEACQSRRFDAEFLRRYEDRWRGRLGSEVRTAQWFRGLLTLCTDAEIDVLVQAVGTPAVQDVIRDSARFNWHRDVVVALVRQPGVVSSLLRSLFR
jgi:geranylgeranyl reductase family protein